MTRIILHSDDLGITSSITKNMLDSWRAGHLKSFSIIANGSAINEISDALTSSPELKARIAVHFNLTEGFSSANAREIPLLVNDVGEFRHSFLSLLISLIFFPQSKRSELLRQIGVECTAQIHSVRSVCAGRNIDAIDGHNHIHMIPGIFKVVAHSASTAGIKGIRVSAEPFFIVDPWTDWLRLFWWINLIKHTLLNFFSISAFRIVRQFNLHSPLFVIGILYSGRMSARHALYAINSAKGVSEIEVLFHIGKANPTESGRWNNENYAKFHLSKLRDFEREEIGYLANLLNNELR